MIPYSRQIIEAEEINAVIKTLKSNYLTQGKNLLNFIKKCNVNIEVVFHSNSIIALTSKGIIVKAKKEVESILLQLKNVKSGDLIVGIEPSEVLTWRDEVRLLTNKKIPIILLFEELLLKLEELGVLPNFNALNSKVWVYEHCHQKALAETSNLKKALLLIPHLQVEVIESGCCGMAGEFGYKHSKLSKKIAHNSLGEYMGKIKYQDILVVTGTSCRKQVIDTFSVQPQNLPQLFLNSVEVKS